MKMKTLILTMLLLTGFITSANASYIQTPYTIPNGGTGATTQQDALDAIVGSVSTGFVRCNGTHCSNASIQAGDVPTLNQDTTGAAAKGTTVAVSNSASYYLGMFSSSSNGNQVFNLGSGMTFNPSTNVLTTTTFAGALSGNATTATSATTATTATNANNGATVAASTNASYFPLFAASSTNGNQPFNLGTGLSFNPSTNVLTTTTFAGALTGHASLDCALTGCTFSGAVDMDSHQIHNLTDPTSAQDAATQAYVLAHASAFTVVDGGNTAYTIAASDGEVRDTTTLTADRAYTLPVCNASNIGEKHYVKNLASQTHNITLTAAGSDNVDGSASFAILPGDSYLVVCAAFSSAGTWDLN